MASFIVYGDASGQVTVKAPAVAGTNTITFPAETGTLYTSASTSYLNGQIAWDTTVKTSGFTAVAYGGYFCNTTSAAFTVTLPSSPTRGQFVVIVDYAGTSATNNITVAGNGAKINGNSSNKLLQTNRQGITFTYIDSTQGWLATSNVYGGSTPFINAPYTASYLVVAGGAAGGWNNGGGGGAGGYLTGTATFNVGTTYTVTVGGGGTAVTTYGSRGGNGSDSIISGSGLSTITSTGGGGGGSYLAPSGGSGGSGGGGCPADSASSPGSGTPGQGNGGGPAGSPNTHGSGGGGAGAVGGLPNGGDGSASSITGTPATTAGGGGGGAGNQAAGSGGAGGGGAGGVTGGPARQGTAGTTNTGSGGGGTGGGGGLGSTPSGAGGSGVVFISVPTASYSGTTTGSPTITTNGSNTIIQYTASGTYVG